MTDPRHDTHEDVYLAEERFNNPADHVFGERPSVPDDKVLVTCRECATEYLIDAALKAKSPGSKWTSLCGSCLRWEI